MQCRKKGDCARLQASCPLASFPRLLMRKCRRKLFLWGNSTASNLPMSIWTINFLECCQHWQIFRQQWTLKKNRRNVMSSILVGFWKLFLTGRAGLSPPPALAGHSSPGVSAYRDLPKYIPLKIGFHLDLTSNFCRFTPRDGGDGRSVFKTISIPSSPNPPRSPHMIWTFIWESLRNVTNILPVCPF